MVVLIAPRQQHLVRAVLLLGHTEQLRHRLEVEQQSRLIVDHVEEEYEVVVDKHVLLLLLIAARENKHSVQLLKILDAVLGVNVEAAVAEQKLTIIAILFDTLQEGGYQGHDLVDQHRRSPSILSD
jgi:hypothetical protein